MSTHDHSEIEKRAREKWRSLNLYTTDLSAEDKDLYYLLVEFPYPSGDLHIGHWYAFSVTDIYARMLRMQGKNVFFPIGFDAFGLPAENAAIKHGVNPRAWTLENIERMRTQIESMGTSFDWSKEVIACQPEYYAWTQWLFAKLFEHGLAKRREAPVKWCPKDQTVLANEQVIEGMCERCSTPVEEKRLTQWFLSITEYADRLLEGLETLPWREEIKEAQRAWIGKSEGAKIRFVVQGGDTDECVEVFTTRPDTLYGATYLVIAPEHTLAVESTEKSILQYRTEAQKKTERERSENKEKTGVKFENKVAINPATNEEIPIFVADYVLGSYGTGAIMAVPAHDERDFAFAKKYGLPIRHVVEPTLAGENHLDTPEYCFTGDGTLKNSGPFSGRKNREVIWELAAHVRGERSTNYRIRDWLVSRQRYWGCPIPIVYDPNGKPHAIPKEHLPWLLPEDVNFMPTGKSPLASSKELQERVTRIFGEGWTPEYDTLDTFVDSSWYFLRYIDSQNAHNFSDAKLMKKWMPVRRYSGGSEHTTLHLLYARFFTKALFDLALVPCDEPFLERYNRGIILGPDGQKMSKSKGNVLNPDEFVRAYGADAVRIYLAFIGPYNEPGSYPWKLDGVASMRKFLDRVARLYTKIDDTEIPLSLTASLARASKKISADGDRFKFNTGVAALMTLTNELEGLQTVPREAYADFVRLIAPFAPHLAEDLFEKLGGEGSVHQSPWPAYDPGLLEPESATLVVQVMGKHRGAISVAPDASEEDVIRAASSLTTVQAALQGEPPTRTIYLPGKVINFLK